MKILNKHYQLFFLIAVAGIPFFTSCKKIVGGGPVVMETRNVSNFKQIKSDFSGDIIITQGNTFEVKIEGPQNVINTVQTNVKGDVLNIKIKNAVVVKGANKLKVYITAPEITAMSINGSGSISGGDFTGNMSLMINGSGNINLAGVTGGSLHANISGSGYIQVDDGAVTDETVNIDGSGDVKIANVQSHNSDVHVSGSGNTNVYVTDFLKVRINSSGDVYYRGEPTIDVDISGSGKLKPM